MLDKQAFRVCAAVFTEECLSCRLQICTPAGHTLAGLGYPRPQVLVSPSSAATDRQNVPSFIVRCLKQVMSNVPSDRDDAGLPALCPYI
jgi:hypothetical protein